MTAPGPTTPAPLPPGHRTTRCALVTGGAGFIGSHLVDLLLARGDAVTVIDDLSTGALANLPDHPRLRFLHARVGDALPALDPSIRFDEVYHLAAAVGVALVVRDPIASIETNVEETAALFRFLLARGRPFPATLIASSSEVYGKSTKAAFAEDDDAVYGPTTVPRWSYACSKAIDEHLTLAYHAMHGLPGVIARFFNTVGPRQVGTYGMVLPRFVAAALSGEPLIVHGDGTQSRCFGHVLDVVGVLPLLLATNACHGRVFNVGSDRPITIADLADLVIRTLGSRSTIHRIPYAEAFAGAPGTFEDLHRRQPDLRRIREAVGFEPRRSLETTIRDVADHLRGARP